MKMDWLFLLQKDLSQSSFPSTENLITSFKKNRFTLQINQRLPGNKFIETFLSCCHEKLQ